MAFGVKTNERPGTRAQVRYVRMSASKARAVLDLIRGMPAKEAREVLRFVERDAAIVIGKLLDSAVANAEHNDSQDPEEVFVSACFADEGPTLKRWRPRARGRATRIRKRTCHITIIVSRMEPKDIERVRAKRAGASGATGAGRRSATESRRARVARSRAAAGHDHDHVHDHDDVDVDAAEEIPGEPTEETIEAAEAIEDAVDEVEAVEPDEVADAEVGDDEVSGAVEEVAPEADDDTENK
ncbi:MAG: large subunit ribosomal protein [Nocardioidaceae bacterium]|nr:large subunit ribosomal protein [Nocardioidaceae bacterium]